MTAVLSQSLAHEVLGVLLNGASHVASLYASVSREENGRVDVNAFLSTLDLLVREGLISPEADTGFGLVPVDPSTNASRLSAYRDVLPKVTNPMWDDIGLWYRVTPRGEARWRLVAGEEVLPLVDVKLDIEHRSVTAVAPTEAEAERAIADAIGAIPGGQLLKGTRVIERGISVTLPDGRALKEGIRVTYQVRGPFRSPPARD